MVASVLLVKDKKTRITCFQIFCDRLQQNKRQVKPEVKDPKLQELQERLEARKAGRLTPPGNKQTGLLLVAFVLFLFLLLFLFCFFVSCQATFRVHLYNNNCKHKLNLGT